MSIAVRVSVWILGVLVVVSAAVAVLALVQKQSLQGQNQTLSSRIKDDEARLADVTASANSLKDEVDQDKNKISQTQQEKAQVQGLYDDLKKKSDDLQSQLDQANSDRDEWKSKVSTLQQERDDLMQKFKDRPTQIVYKDRIVKVTVPAADNNPIQPISSPVVDVTSSQGDQYWASILKQKAALQVELEKEKYELDQAALQVVDLKKQNSDLALEVRQITNEKDEIVQKIKFGQDLADNLSIDLARSRNDQKAVNDRADRLKGENLDLQNQIRDLTSTKLELEKTVSRLTDDKDAMQKKLIETESVIQGRIDDIWKIKQSLDQRLSENSSSPSPSSGSMELPPIIVNAPNGNGNGQQVGSTATGKTQGTVISINQVNNFVIVDLGQENSPVTIGSALKVYRNSNEIATLEVIQLRRDICAADIKDKNADLQVGDVVKFN